MDCQVVQICENRSHVPGSFLPPRMLKVLSGAPLTFKKAKEGWSRRLRGQNGRNPAKMLGACRGLVPAACCHTEEWHGQISRNVPVTIPKSQLTLLTFDHDALRGISFSFLPMGAELKRNFTKCLNGLF